MGKQQNTTSDTYIDTKRVLWATTIEGYHHDGTSAFVVHFDNNAELVLTDSKQIEDLLRELKEGQAA